MLRILHEASHQYCTCLVPRLSISREMMMTIIVTKRPREKKKSKANLNVNSFLLGENKKKDACPVTQTYIPRSTINLCTYCILGHSQYQFFRVPLIDDDNAGFFWEAGDVDLGEFESTVDISTKSFLFLICSIELMGSFS